MTAARIFVYGAGGHGKVVGDILLCSGITDLLGFVDDDERRIGGLALGLPVFGDGEWLRAQSRVTPVAVALGIGDNAARRRVAQQCAERGIEIRTAVHPSAVIARSAQAGTGTVIMANAVINPDARIGAGAIINTGAIVEHDCVVGDFAHVAPNAVMGGASQLGAESQLSLGAVILPCTCVGSGTMVGAGAVVTKDVPAGETVVGVPAKPLKCSYRSPRE